MSVVAICSYSFVETAALVVSSNPLPQSRSGSREREPADQSPSRSKGNFGTRRSSRSRSQSRSRSPRRSYGGSQRYNDSRSRSPQGRRSSPDEKKFIGDDDVTDEFIRIVALEVKGRDSDFEKILKEREKNNSKYMFLTDYKVGIISGLPELPLTEIIHSTGGTDIIDHWCKAASRSKRNLRTRFARLFIHCFMRLKRL